MTEHGQSRKREQAIQGLLVTATIAEAAKFARVSVRTILRWRREPSFAAAYRQAKSDLLEQATARLRTESGAAVATLAAVASDVEAAPSARVSASRTILELALKAHEIEDLDERLRKLERQGGDNDGF